MQKICAASGVPFEVTDEDLQFYEKISPVLNGKKYLISPPTLCPDERHRRRLTFRNDRKLYRRKCAASNADIISMYAPEVQAIVYEKNIWWGDSWDGIEYGREFDFSRPFFEQFSALMSEVPHPSLNILQNENSEYVNYTGWNKNCYLCFAGNSLEDSMYCYNSENSRDCMDTLDVLECESCYQVIQSSNCYHLLHSLHCKSCSDSAFLEDCTGCSNCFLCWNLRNKKYCILNKQYSKEEYSQKLEQFRAGASSGEVMVQGIFQQERLQYPKRDTHNIQAENCTGEYIVQGKNCHDCYVMHKDCEDCTRIIAGFPKLRDSRDCSFAGENADFMYEGGCVGDRCHCCVFGHTVINGSQNVYYSDFMINCQHCFGCSALRNKKYCILNKQYTKEEYEELVPKIIEHMQLGGEWGEFFPIEISPFAYNETVAQEYFPLTKEEVLQRGWKWKEEEKPDFSGITKKIPANKLPDTIEEIPDDILNWAIECEESKRYFKIQKAELEFYRKMNLPIPHYHPDVRHTHRMQLRNPRKLWDRTCAKCSKPIQTTYSPDRPEIVYCEQCYLKAVY